MEDKIIVSGEQAREQIIKATNIVIEAVGATLGPNGKTVLISSPHGEPKNTKDGVSVAREISVEDPIENLIIKTFTSIPISMEVGDGTTSSIVFAGALLKEVNKLIASGHEVHKIIDGIDKGVEAALKFIEAQTQKIDQDLKQIERVAVISGNSEEVGKQVAQAYQEVGADGVIMVEESKSHDTEIKLINGMQLDKGYCSPYFITNAEKRTCELENAYILVYEGKISTVQSILPILEQIAQQGKALLIVAEDVDGEALTALVVNRLRGKLKVAAVKAPSFGDRRKEMLEDLAILTGTQVINDTTSSMISANAASSSPFQNINLQFLGQADKVNISKDSTIITNDKADKNQLEERIKQLKNDLQNANSDYDKNKLQERIAFLSKGVASIKVGGYSGSAIGELKDRYDDAVCAVKAAVQKGIVPGGGALLIHIGSKLQNEEIASELKPGWDAFCNALSSITFKIVANGKTERQAHEVVNKIASSDDCKYGYDARENRYGNMFEFGVVDAALVLEFVLRNGAEGVKQLLNTNTLIAHVPAKDMPSMPGMGMM